MGEGVKINFDLIPEHTRENFMKKFIHNYESFWADPKNEAEFQQWKAERKKEGETQ